MSAAKKKPVRRSLARRVETLERSGRDAASAGRSECQALRIRMTQLEEALLRVDALCKSLRERQKAAGDVLRVNGMMREEP